MSTPQARSGPSDPREIPEVIYDAFVAHINALPDEAAADTRSNGRLWLSASWKQAQALNMSDLEYSRWVRVGLWNLAGDTNSLRSLDVYRALAGKKGPLLAMAGISPESAVAQSKESGITSLLEGCQAVIGLMDLGSDLIEETESEAAQPPKPSERLDFS